MSERIERWANVYGELDGKEYIDGFYLTRDQARNNAAFGYLRQASLVEIRDGEPHPDETAKVIAALTERAEKAEREYAELKESYDSVASMGLRAQERAEKAEAEIERIESDDQRYVSVKTLDETRAAYDAVCKAAVKRADQAEATVMARDVEIDTLRSFLKQFEDGGMSGREVREARGDERTKFERETARLFRAAYLTHGDGDFSELEEARKLTDHYFGAKEDAK